MSGSTAWRYANILALRILVEVLIAWLTALSTRICLVLQLGSFFMMLGRGVVFFGVVYLYLSW